MNSVSFCGASKAGYAEKPTSKAKRGARIGATFGVVAGVSRVVKNRSAIKGMIDSVIKLGVPKAKVYCAAGAGAVLGIALVSGIMSLVGAGVGKLVDHFKKPKAEKVA